MMRNHPLLRYFFRRILHLVPTLAGVVLLTFILFNVVSGSPAEDAQGQNATAEQLDAYDARHHLDKPLVIGRWVSLRLMSDWSRRNSLADWKNVPGAEYSENAGGSILLRGGAEYNLPLEYALMPSAYRWWLTSSAEGQGIEWRAYKSGENTPLSAAVIDEGEEVKGHFDLQVPKGISVDRVSMYVPVGASCRIHSISFRRKSAGWLDTQLFSYVCGILRGDLGDSLIYGEPVSNVLMEKVWVSLSLTIPILIGGVILSVMLGMICAAWRSRWPDRFLLVSSTALMSLNYVVWVIAGQYFLAYKAEWFPIWGYEGWTYLILPVMIGIVSGLGRDVRFYRTVILDEIGKPYVRTAMAKGIARWRVLFVHVLRNCLIPIVTSVSMSIPFLFAGSILLESFYGIPGLGGVSLNAIHSGDANMVRAVVLVGSLLYQASNLMADFLYAWLDPRVRLG